MTFPLRLCLAALVAGAAPSVRAQALKAPHPATVMADRIEGVNEESIEASGSVHLQRDDVNLYADFLRYRALEDEVEAEGNIRLKSNTYQIDGPRLRLKLTEQVGYIERPEYVFKGTPKKAGPFNKANAAHGVAERVNFEGENQYSLEGATFSTCEPGDNSWYARFSQLDFDYDREEGEGWGAKVVFKGVPIFYTPYITFPLSRERRSGFLAPTWGNTTLSGLELMIPYYWNIAPNMDATFSPRYYNKRGTQLGTEFRYLEPQLSGTFFGEMLPDDQIRGGNRWAGRWQHRQALGYGFSASVDASRVSDDFYYKDLASQITQSAQTQLAQQATLGFAWQGWSAHVRALRYQTLQSDPLALVARPYELRPQFVVQGRTLFTPSFEASLLADYTNFSHPDIGKLEAERMVIYPKLALPYVTPGFNLTPRFGVHATRYTFAEPVPAGLGHHYDRVVPIASLDTGFVFERPIEAFGRRQVQTLEPRLFYLRVPFRDQSKLAHLDVDGDRKSDGNFDSSVLDFNFAQIFAENQFSGHDRIADANQATLALTSRLLDETTGKEYFRAMLGQRFYFSQQRVTLNPDDAQRTDKKTDILGAVSGELLRHTFVDAAAQYNPSDHRFERFNVATRYQPSPGHVLNAAYRLSRLQTAPFAVDVRNLDVSGQWPVYGKWNTVARYNYSVKEQRVIESLGGVEYFAGCWSTRLVLQRFATSTTEYKTAIFLQLELTDFGRLGTNPMEAINRGIPGYSPNTQASTSSSSTP
jgi:LPS-assembly protein